MDNFIARANIDHFLEMLRDHSGSADTRAIHKLLVEEESKLSRDTEQLEFVESRAAKCRHHFDDLCLLRDGFADGSADRMRAEQVVIKFEATLQLVEGFCHKMRSRVNGSSL